MYPKRGNERTPGLPWEAQRSVPGGALGKKRNKWGDETTVLPPLRFKGRYEERKALEHFLENR